MIVESYNSDSELSDEVIEELNNERKKHPNASYVVVISTQDYEYDAHSYDSIQEMTEGIHASESEGWHPCAIFYNGKPVSWHTKVCYEITIKQVFV